MVLQLNTTRGPSMTVHKQSVSFTDAAFAFARELVEAGEYPNVSAAVSGEMARAKAARDRERALLDVEVQTGEGKLFLFVGIDRTSKFAVAQLVATADRKTAWEFLQHMLEAVPYQVHTILTDNGIQFAEQPRNRNTIYSRPMRFDMICEANGIEHRLTKPNHPWTNGQVERMNRTIKEATVKRFHYDSHDQLRTHLADFLAAYNFARRLKTLGGLTPYEYICKIWTSEPDRFILNPIHQMPGLNSPKLHQFTDWSWPLVQITMWLTAGRV